MLRSFLSIALMQSVVTAAALDPFTVPSFDYQGLTTASSEVLAALQQDGIIALQNIPQYGELRRAYLQAATKCALTATTNDNGFLLTKILQDGTERFTISTTAGKDLSKAAQDTQALCPEYVATYRTFSQLVENVVDALGKSLDASNSFSVPSHPELTGSELLSDSVHLDHFHAYESVPSTASDELSLEMHVDNGMMIAMTAPYYFEVSPSSNEPTPVGVSESDYVNGLMIENRAGKLVQPVFEQDELVIMVGAGFQEWVRTTPALRPVPHGMKFPTLATSSPKNRLIRAWFGKMVLMAKDQVMVNTRRTFEDFAKESRRFLMQDQTSGDHEQDAFAAIACPKDHRRLHGSDNGCVVKKCASKAGKNPEVPCSMQCNFDEVGRPGAARLCEENCDCEVTSNSTAAAYCWMLCSPKLPEGTCDSQGQRCATGAEAPFMNQQKFVCTSTAADVLKFSGNVAPPSTVPTKSSSASSTILQITLSCAVVILAHLL